LRKATISFVISVRPSVHRTSRSQWTDFFETSYLSIFRNFIEKIQDSTKSDKKTGTLCED